jgi:hypothetical protein
VSVNENNRPKIRLDHSHHDVELNPLTTQLFLLTYAFHLSHNATSIVDHHPTTLASNPTDSIP